MQEDTVLIICYGNELRGDDAAALAVADLLAARLAGPGRFAKRPQLDPSTHIERLPALDVSLAEDISTAELVIFVDAEPGAEGGPRVLPVQPAAGALRPSIHTLTPADLLALSASLYGRAPEALLVAVPAFEFEHRDGLSEGTRAAVKEAADLISRLAGDYRTRRSQSTS